MLSEPRNQVAKFISAVFSSIDAAKVLQSSLRYPKGLFTPRFNITLCEY